MVTLLCVLHVLLSAGFKHDKCTSILCAVGFPIHISDPDAEPLQELASLSSFHMQ